MNVTLVIKESRGSVLAPPPLTRSGAAHLHRVGCWLFHSGFPSLGLSFSICTGRGLIIFRSLPALTSASCLPLWMI